MQYTIIAVTTVHITLSWHIHFITWSVCLLTFFTHLTHSPSAISENYQLVSVSTISCLDLHVNKIMQYLSFSVQLISLSIVFWKFIHDVADGKISFLWLNNIPLCVCACVPHFLYLLFNDRHGFLHILALVNNVSWKKGVHISFQGNIFVFFW